MSAVLGEHARRLVAAPLTVPQAIPRLGRALWLYIWLLSIVNSSGHVCRTLASLADDLAVRPEQVETWLARLADAKLVDIQNPAPFLVIKLRFWPGDADPEADPEIGISGRSSISPRDVPVGKQACRQASKQANGKGGGAGEGEALLAEAIAVLGSADKATVGELVARFPAEVVRRALLRVKATPEEKIRKSRLALFRHLLVEFSNESQ